MRPLIIITILITLSTISELFGQDLIQIKVIDAENNNLIEGASTTLHYGKEEKLIDFGITNTKGIASLNPKGYIQNLKIKIKMLGYAPRELTGIPAQQLIVKLKRQSIQINDVVVKASRIWKNSDTLKYNASSFISEKDQNLEDLLKRMPGIEIDEKGTISHNGKNIGKIKIEGADMMGSNYKTLSKSLPAKAIQQVEVINNDQEIAVLKNIVSSEITNLNLKLKNDFKNRWIIRTNLVIGSDTKHVLYQPAIYPMQITKRTQSLYHSEASNLGRGIHNNSSSFSLDLPDIPDIKLLVPPKNTPPLKENRSLFDQTYSFSCNKLYNLNKKKQLKINGALQRNTLTEEFATKTIYYFPDDTLHISEDFKNKTKKEQFELGFDFKNNTPKSFYRNNLTLKGENLRVSSNIREINSIEQQIEEKHWSICTNSLYTFLINNRPTTWNTTIGYRYRNQQLIIFDDIEKHRIEEFYGRTNFTYRLSLKNILWSNSLDLEIEQNRFRSSQNIGAMSNIQWRLHELEVNFSTTPKLSFLSDKTLFLPDLRILGKYRLNFDWQIKVMHSYKKSLASPILAFTTPYKTNYRTWRKNNKGIPTSENRLHFFKIEYSNPIKELFGYLEGYYSQNHLNHILQQQIIDNKVHNKLIYKGHNSISKTLSSRLTKTFFESALMLSLDIRYSENKRAQLYNNKIQRINFKSLRCSPKLSWNSSIFSFDYQPSFNFKKNNFGNKKDTPQLLDINQIINTSIKLNDFEINACYEWFKTDLRKNQATTNSFFDLSLGYYSPIGLFKLEAINLFNVNRFNYTIAQNTNNYYFDYKIRPGEFLLSLNMKI